MAFERLEPCAVKVACTVLRGLGGGNAILATRCEVNKRFYFSIMITTSVKFLSELKKQESEPQQKKSKIHNGALRRFATRGRLNELFAWQHSKPSVPPDEPMGLNQERP